MDNNLSPNGSRPSTPRDDPDARGQAALLLSESMLHALVEAGSLTLEAAVAAVRTASSVKEEVAEETGESNATMQESLGLLGRIERSLQSDEAPEPLLSVV